MQDLQRVAAEGVQPVLIDRVQARDRSRRPVVQFDVQLQRLDQSQKVEMGLGEVDVAYNPNYIVALHEDERGVVWTGTWGGGLARFDGNQWRNFTMADGLPANHVFLLAPAENGEMWVGTSGGLARFDGERFIEVLTTHQGLYADNVFSLARGDDGSLWVGSYGGVARIKRGGQGG